MRIRSLRVKNYRSILDEEITLGSLTALVGRNGSGKSSFLNAFDLFYNPTTQLAAADFYSEHTEEPIEITVTFDSLNEDEQAEFSHYLQDDALSVVGVFVLDSGKGAVTYHGNRLQHPGFSEVRKQTNKTKLRTEYNQLIEHSPYLELSRASTADEAKKSMQEWELQHPESCEPERDDGQFFGWTNVGQGYLRRRTQLIRIPAVRDAGEEATEGRGSAISEIMNLVVRRVLTNHPEIVALREHTANEFSRIMDDSARPQLKLLENDLTQILSSFVPDASVALDWREFPKLEIGDPQTDVGLHEDGYTATVTRTGHGLQRAFIFALLQHLSAVRRLDDDTDPDPYSATEEGSPLGEPSATPDLILAIEEPELYQHPSRQRHLAEVLLQLSEGEIPGVAASTQVVYTTHSPLFVGLDRFDDVRVLRKREFARGQPKVTTATSTTMESVAQSLQAASATDAAYTAATLRPRLQAVMTPVVNEGFFADIVVLVEGEGDRAAILGAGRAMNFDFDAEGIAVIPCSGKDNLDRPLIIFRSLDIPSYVVWDGDRGKGGATPASNLRLLRILKKEEVEWPHHVDEISACFDITLDETLKGEIEGQVFKESLHEAQELFGLSGTAARKNALVIQRLVERSISQNAGSKTLMSIVRNIMELKKKAALES